MADFNGGRITGPGYIYIYLYIDIYIYIRIYIPGTQMGPLVFLGV